MFLISYKFIIKLITQLEVAHHSRHCLALFVHRRPPSENDLLEAATIPPFHIPRIFRNFGQKYPKKNKINCIIIHSKPTMPRKCEFEWTKIDGKSSQNEKIERGNARRRILIFDVKLKAWERKMSAGQ
jgi:hypothetical protein